MTQDLVDLWVSYAPGWSDLLDIALMAALFYRTMLVLRGTRAFQVLVGLGILGAIYVASEQLGLYTIRWVLDKFFVYAVLAVIILFQNDIRRGLARAGGRFFSSIADVGEGLAVEEIVKAAFAMASRRIGALIVIERGARLDDLVEGGHIIDGRVSLDLLLAIFHPTSPLHDGAVVVQNGRLAAAKVFLPLSLSPDLRRWFGTRHLAAIGITEETDAVVVVVSEERGEVSLVQAGALTRVADTNELRQRLQELLHPGQSRSEARAGAAA